jgi:hypothetical protein
MLLVMWHRRSQDYCLGVLVRQMSRILFQDQVQGSVKWKSTIGDEGHSPGWGFGDKAPKMDLGLRPLPQKLTNVCTLSGEILYNFIYKRLGLCT